MKKSEPGMRATESGMNEKRSVDFVKITNNASRPYIIDAEKRNNTYLS